jgi:hypothetical protein
MLGDNNHNMERSHGISIDHECSLRQLLENVRKGTYSGARKKSSAWTNYRQECLVVSHAAADTTLRWEVGDQIWNDATKLVLKTG